MAEMERKLETVEDVYKALTGQGELEWIGESKTAAALYFQKGRKRFKIFFDDSNVEISVKKRLFKNEYWDSLGQRHYTEPEDTVQDVFETVMWCLQEFGGRNRDVQAE